MAIVWYFMKTENATKLASGGEDKQYCDFVV